MNYEVLSAQPQTKDTHWSLGTGIEGVVVADVARRHKAAFLHHSPGCGVIHEMPADKGFYSFLCRYNFILPAYLFYHRTQSDGA